MPSKNKPTYERGDARQQRFHEITQKNRAQDEKPSIAGRHFGSTVQSVAAAAVKLSNSRLS